MAAIAFMPWCRIDRNYDLIDLRIVRFDRGRRVEDLDDTGQDDVQKILATYKDIKGRPVNRAALLVLGNRHILDDLSDEEREFLYEHVEIVRFAGLAKREYFDPISPYCNSDCFTCYVQRFTTVDFTSLSTRRREGSTQSGWPLSQISITVPPHCSPIRQVVIDESLLASLFAYRRDHTDEWTRWLNAVSCFNQANTDAENFRYQVEWVLLSSAFQHLLHAKSNALDVATRFAKLFTPTKNRVVRDAIRRSARWREEHESLRFEWMREFYRIRGDFAHGQLETAQDMVWSLGEHLVLATIAFPLLVKILLHRIDKYALTDNDISQVEAFETFADTPRFTDPPTDSQDSMDSHWRRVRTEVRRDIAISRALAEWAQSTRNGVGATKPEEPTD